MRTALQYRVATVLLVTMVSFPICHVARADDSVPKELIQYIRDARQRGIKEPAIRQQARSAGWSSALVEQAIAQETGGQRSAPAAAAQSSALPAVVVPRRAEGPLEASAGLGAADDYLIGAGDTLQVSVWKEPDVTVPSVVVRPDGKITMPLIKEVEVAGLTPRQAERRITEGLSKYISDANVTVVVAAINSKKVYVIGAARKEGTLPYTYGMTVMQALSEAGGLTDYAKRRRLYILRTENGREYRLDFNYEEVVRGERMEQNILLLPGDTVVIPH